MGPIAVCKEFIPLLKQSEASRIINISSSCAETRLPMASVYGASKVNRFSAKMVFFCLTC